MKVGDAPTQNRYAARLTGAKGIFEKLMCSDTAVTNANHDLDVLTTHAVMLTKYFNDPAGSPNFMAMWGRYLVRKGLSIEAVPVLAQALDDFIETLGHRHRDTLAIRHSFLALMPPVDEVVEEWEQLVADMSQVLGDSHVDTLVSRHSLASSYLAAGRLSDSGELLAVTLAETAHVLGEEHSQTLHCRVTMGLLYCAFGFVDEGLGMQERAIADGEQFIGIRHRDLLSWRYSLAVAHSSSGRYAKAIDLLEVLARNQLETLGEGHDDYLSTSEELAFVYCITGQRAKEEAAFAAVRSSIPGFTSRPPVDFGPDVFTATTSRPPSVQGVLFCL